MSSNPQSSAAGESSPGTKSENAPSSRSERLPFEPTSNRKKQPKKSPVSSPATENSPKSGKQKNQPTLSQRAFTGVPDDVSKRMARRMAAFCGIPTALGMLTFVVSYVIVSQHWFKLPTVAVFLVSLGFFGLGVLGLSYGALSASWDEGRVGSWLGFSEFQVNWGRAIASWKEARQRSSSS